MGTLAENINSRGTIFLAETIFFVQMIKADLGILRTQDPITASSVSGNVYRGRAFFLIKYSNFRQYKHFTLQGGMG